MKKNTTNKNVLFLQENIFCGTQWKLVSHNTWQIFKHIDFSAENFLSYPGPEVIKLFHAQLDIFMLNLTKKLSCS